MSAARRRLQSPTGTVVWRVVGPSTPNGGGDIYPTEAEAKAKAKAASGEPRVIYPVVIELDDSQEKSA